MIEGCLVHNHEPRYITPEEHHTLLSQSCEVHGDHRPRVITPHHHHIVPLGMGGPNIASNIVTICPTGHANVHAALAALVFEKPMPKVARSELKLAKLGYDRWVAAGRQGNPHAAYGLAA